MSNISAHGGPYIGAMLRVIWLWVREQIFAGAVAAGYDDLNPAHVGLFRYPTLDGLRPTELAHQLQIYQILRELHRQRGSTLILVTHDLNLAESFCSRVVFLKEGRIEADVTKRADSSDPMITPGLIQKVFGVESQIITDGTHSRVILSYGN